MSFMDKVVVVTGSGKGIGKCIAKSYANLGAKVIVAEKDVDAGEETVREIKCAGGEALYCQTDVSNPGDIENLIKKAEEVFDKIDILVNNVGIGIWKSPYDLTIEEWDKGINTNLRSVFLCSREAAKLMRKSGGGYIVNIASTRALMSEENSEVYAASKGGIVSLTHSLAASLSKDKIKVNCISPGWIETGDYEKLREIDHAQHFSGRVGRPEDIALACIYLTNQDNEFVNSINLVIDGGMTKKMIYEP